jgi:hypothetical protein
MTRQPGVIYLFCGQGGGAGGYHLAGFRTVGIDVKAQPRYPSVFQQGDAMAWLRWAAGELPRRPWPGCPVPPAYTRLIGEQFMLQLGTEASVWQKAAAWPGDKLLT